MAKQKTDCYRFCWYRTFSGKISYQAYDLDNIMPEKRGEYVDAIQTYKISEKEYLYSTLQDLAERYPLTAPIKEDT